MKADLAAKLQSAMREEVARNYPVTRVTGVTCNTSKSLMLHHYTCNTLKSASWENDEKERVTKGVTIPPAPDSSLAEDTEIELEERKAMAMGGVPEPYLDGWARLQCQKLARPLKVLCSISVACCSTRELVRAKLRGVSKLAVPPFIEFWNRRI
jgi:hypothetical protein